MKYSFVFRNSSDASDRTMFAIHRHNCRDLGRERRRGNTVIDVEAEHPREAAIAELMGNYGWDRAEAEENIGEVDIYPCCSCVGPLPDRPMQRLRLGPVVPKKGKRGR